MIPPEVRALLEAPNYVHLSTLRRDGTPRNWVVWAGLEGDRVLICTTTHSMKATHMQRDPRVGLSVIDLDNPTHLGVRVGEIRAVRDGNIVVKTEAPLERLDEAYHEAIPRIISQAVSQ